MYQQCYCAINTLTQPIKLVGLRICHSSQKITLTCDLYWQVFDTSTLLATRNLYSETSSANTMPVRYTFGPFRAPRFQNWRGTCPCLVYGSGAYLDNSASSHSTKRTTTAKQAQRKLQSQSNRTEIYTGGKLDKLQVVVFHKLHSGLPSTLRNSPVHVHSNH